MNDFTEIEFILLLEKDRLILLVVTQYWNWYNTRCHTDFFTFPKLS